MINEQETNRRFGYFAQELSPFSSKKVVAVCQVCNAPRDIAKHLAVRSSMCSRCQRSKQAKIIANKNRIGRRHSEATKDKMSKSRIALDLKGEKSWNYGKKRTDEHKRKIAESNKKRIVSDESRQKMSAARKGKPLSAEQKKKMGISRTGEKNPNYGKPAAHGKGSYYIKKDGSKIWMRSSWELKTASHLDALNVNWIYEAEAYPITFSDKKGTYRPDFTILDEQQNVIEIWEVKGYWRDDAKDKYDAFILQYPQFKVTLMNESELKTRGII